MQGVSISVLTQPNLGWIKQIKLIVRVHFNFKSTIIGPIEQENEEFDL